MKKLFALLIALCLLAFAGCAQKPDDNDLTAAVATVNGETIARSEFAAIYDMYVAYYSQYYSEEDYPDYYSGLKTDIIDDLVRQLVLTQKAKAAGYYDYTEQQRADALKKVQDEIEAEINTKAASLQEIDSHSSEHDYQYYYDMAYEKIYEDLRLNGETVESLAETELENAALTAFQQEMVKNAAATDEDIQVKYNELLKEQKESYLGDETTDDYASFVSDYNAGAEDIVYYLDGYVLVQHILILYSDEDSEAVEAAYDALYTAGSTMQTAQDELDALNEQLETAEESEKEELQQQIEAKQQEIVVAAGEKQTAQENYENARKAAEEHSLADAQAVYESVKNADEAQFIKVMSEKTGDSMNDEESAKKGYLVGPEDGMVDEFHDAALALENDGDISQPVASDYGYHIIRRMRALPAGEVPLAQVRDYLESELTADKQYTAWESLQQQWYDESDITIDEKWINAY